MTAKLENWSVVSSNSVYDPPEFTFTTLAGEVYGHPRFDDGLRIMTSRVVAANGNNVKTRSGTEYELGSPSENYVKWMKDNKIEFDEKNPIKEVRF